MFTRNSTRWIRHTLTLAVCSFTLVGNALAQPRFGAAFTDHHDPYGARVTEIHDGYPSRNIQSDTDGRQYYLSPNLHVITEVNDLRVGNASECVMAIAASPQRMSFSVYNLESGTHRKYHVVLNGDTKGVLKLNRSLKWVAGETDPKYKNVISGPEEDKWFPAPGYTWVDPQGKFGPVRWTPGVNHPDYHIVAADDGKWSPMPGHGWVSQSAKDLRVKWIPGQEHPHYYLVAQKEHNNWQPANGYEWLTNTPGDLRVTESTYEDRDFSTRINTGNESFGFDLDKLVHDVNATTIMRNTNSRYKR